MTRFIEQSLADALAEMEYRAASDALRKARIASDYRAQLWSVINHIETGISALSSTLKTKVGVTPRYADHCVKKVQYLLAFEALIYKYLGEERLVHDCRSKHLQIQQDADDAYVEFSKVPNVATSLAWVFRPVQMLHGVKEEWGLLKGFDKLAHEITESEFNRFYQDLFSMRLR
ncbi:MAG: hypothetical protein HC850_10115 [Rhodomicrobium sp.]|nr:hypothetical protein [Rhodomicrobium sp.]